MADVERVQNITLKMAGKEYPLKAKSPEMERYMRLAAEEINRTLARYDVTFPQYSLVDKLVFVALNETVGKLAAQGRSSREADALAALDDELKAYLDKTK